jgi:hypothetical protein
VATVSVVILLASALVAFWACSVFFRARWVVQLPAAVATRPAVPDLGTQEPAEARLLAARPGASRSTFARPLYWQTGCAKSW